MSGTQHVLLVHKKRSTGTKRNRDCSGRAECGNKNKRLMALGTRSICFPVAVAMSLPLVLCNVLTFDTSLGFSDPHRYGEAVARRPPPVLRSALPSGSFLTYLPTPARILLVS